MRIDPSDTLAPAGTVPPMNEMSAALERRLAAETEGDVLFDAGSRGRYATDASVYQIVPVGVFVPKTHHDVETALAIARDLRVPVLPRGGGTSQCGQTTGAALVVDDSKHLRAIVDVDVDARTAVVEPGLVLDHLNAALKPHGLWYPVDVSTSAQATLGGMAGNNSCGSRSIAYGNMVHNVVGLDAWQSDGTLLSLGPVATAGAKERALADFVRDLAAVHRDQIVERWPKVLRRVAGYNLDLFEPQSVKPYTTDGSVNLAHLLVGSEGTLGFTKTLKLKLAELPRAKVLGVVNFPTFHAAMDAAQHLVTLGPVAVELVDRTMLDLGLGNPAFRPAIESALTKVGGRDPEAILLVEFTGADKAALLPKLRDLVALMGDLGLPGSVVEMVDDTIQKNLWEVRKAGLNIMMSLKGDGKPISFIEDCAVPLEHLADYTDALTETFARHGTKGTWYAHASVGTLHVRPIIDLRVGGANGGAAKMRAIADEASALVRKYKGAYSGEHGDGLCRGEWIEWQFGPALVDAFRAIKQRLDPIGLFAPNRIVDPPRMDDGALFRFPPPEPTDPTRKPYRTIALKTVLDWSAWDVKNDPMTEETTAPGTGGDPTGGFAKAVEMCNNNGHCRKFDAGVMCPSYRVTRDERHLTRGRANTLRLALSGQLDVGGRGDSGMSSTADGSVAHHRDAPSDDAFTSHELYDTLDLCVSCKGCKRDCPTGVDMAKMKIEFLAHYKARHGFTWKDRLVAKLPDYAAAASRVPWLMNLRDRLPGAARLSERMLGLSARRTLPRWRSDTFWRSGDRSMLTTAAGTLARAADGGRAAVLFVDTFNGTFESENAWAAARVLTAAGYAVHALEKNDRDGSAHCCGRTYLASGMVDDAKRKAGALVDALLPFARAGIAIVGLEPSCLLTLRDEALSMGLGEPAEAVAAEALLFEEFVAREAKAGRFAVDLKPAGAPILLHGHCHQKAFGAVGPIVDVLKLIPGAKPELIESSCCGMAGAFGYEARHHDVSMAMAEASLLPAIRKQADAIVVADGTSCRHQIADGAQREAVHVALLLERLLVG